MPDFSKRMPGEQWVVFDSPQAAEAYLKTFEGQDATVRREAFPNPEGLYGQVRFPGRIAGHRVYVEAGS